MAANEVPTRPGYYWAKWMMKDDHVPEYIKPFRTWEPVEVFVFHDGELRADIMGETFAQSLDCFHWGERIEPPVDKTQQLVEHARRYALKQSLARYKLMTPDQREQYLIEQKKKG